MAVINKLFYEVEIETYKLEKAVSLIKELRKLGLSKKTINLLVKGITRKFVLDEEVEE